MAARSPLELHLKEQLLVFPLEACFPLGSPSLYKIEEAVGSIWSLKLYDRNLQGTGSQNARPSVAPVAKRISSGSPLILGVVYFFLIMSSNSGRLSFRWYVALFSTKLCLDARSNGFFPCSGILRTVCTEWPALLARSQWRILYCCWGCIAV